MFWQTCLPWSFLTLKVLVLHIWAPSTPPLQKALYKSGVILGESSANERWYYIVSSSLFGWAQTQNEPRKWCMSISSDRVLTTKLCFIKFSLSINDLEYVLLIRQGWQKTTLNMITYPFPNLDLSLVRKMGLGMKKIIYIFNQAGGQEKSHFV